MIRRFDICKPIKSSLVKSVGKLFGVYKDTDLSLRGNLQSSRKIKAVPISATGGDSTFTYNGKTIHKFTSSGSLVIAGGGGEIEYVVIAGGGGGGKGSNNRGGGGVPVVIELEQLLILRDHSPYL